MSNPIEQYYITVSDLAKLRAARNLLATITAKLGSIQNAQTSLAIAENTLRDDEERGRSKIRF